MTEAVEIIGYDESRKSYFMKSFDNKGSSATMYAILQKPGILKFGDSKMKSILIALKDGSTQKISWKISENGKT